MRYRLKERAISLSTDDFVIRDENNNVVFEVSGDLFHIGDTFSIRDRNTGEEVVHIKQRIFSHTAQYDIFMNGAEIASLHKRDEPHPHVEVANSDGTVLYAQGSFEEWDLNIIDHYGRLFAHISKEFSIIGDSYTVDIAPGVNELLILSVAIVLDELREDRKI